MDSQEQIVIAQIGHDDSMTVSNSRHQTQHHPTRVDHQINEKKFFPRHHKCPEMFIFLLTFPCNLNFKKMLRVRLEHSIQVLLSVDDSFRDSGRSAGVHQPNQ